MQPGLLIPGGRALASCAGEAVSTLRAVRPGMSWRGQQAGRACFPGGKAFDRPGREWNGIMSMNAVVISLFLGGAGPVHHNGRIPAVGFGLWSAVFFRACFPAGLSAPRDRRPVRPGRADHRQHPEDLRPHRFADGGLAFGRDHPLHHPSLSAVGGSCPFPFVGLPAVQPAEPAAGDLVWHGQYPGRRLHAAGAHGRARSAHDGRGGHERYLCGGPQLAHVVQRGSGLRPDGDVHL